MFELAIVFLVLSSNHEIIEIIQIISKANIKSPFIKINTAQDIKRIFIKMINQGNGTSQNK